MTEAFQTCRPQVLTPPLDEYADEKRMFQGIPGIERAPGGRLWAVWYGGGVTEDRHNYLMLATSDDGGDTWSDIRTVVDPDGPGPVRAFDPCLWLDPAGRLWLFWAQRDTEAQGDPSETCAMVCANPDAANPAWDEPRPICPGIMMNKPIFASDGAWLLPVSTWYADAAARVVVSSDQGRTFGERGAAGLPDVEQRTFDEHMVVERCDGSLWMLVRTKYGIGESLSTDGGRAWTPIAPSAFAHTSSRFHIRRLASGRLLLVKHGPIAEDVGRSQLSAYLSEDDGTTWTGGLVVDERKGVSYPDATQAPDGTIHLIYDYSRYDVKQILCARFRESDIETEAFASPGATTRLAVNQAFGENPKPR